jgi:hypothetical protein
MLSIVVFTVLGGLAALVAFEIYEEVKGSRDGLYDHYHG